MSDIASSLLKDTEIPENPTEDIGSMTNPKNKHQLLTVIRYCSLPMAHTIHGTGIFTYMNG